MAEPARPRVLLVSQLPDNASPWTVPANEVRGWAYVLGGDTRSFHTVLVAPEALAAYDVVIVELTTNAYSVATFIKRRVPRATVIGLVEGGVEGLAAQEPRDQLAFVECVRQLDLLGVLVEPAVSYYRLLLDDDRRVKWLGIPYPKAYTDALPKPPRRAKAPVIEIAGNLDPGRNALAAMLLVRRLRRSYPHVRARLYVPRPGQMLAGEGLDPTVEYRLERDWAGYYRHHLDVYAMLSLDPRRSWGRPVLDCASALIPYVGSHASQCGSTVGVLTCDPYDADTAYGHLCRLLADPALYEEVIRTQYERLAAFDEAASRARFWRALADRGAV